MRDCTDPPILSVSGAALSALALLSGATRLTARVGNPQQIFDAAHSFDTAYRSARALLDSNVDRTAQGTTGLLPQVASGADATTLPAACSEADRIVVQSEAQPQAAEPGLIGRASQANGTIKEGDLKYVNSLLATGTRTDAPRTANGAAGSAGTSPQSR